MACPIWHHNNTYIVSQKELHVANLNIFYSYAVSQKNNTNVAYGCCTL